MGGIIQFDASLSREFKDLNISWLEQYFYVESHDRRILENCQEEIIDKDGHIFFYQENDIVMGTFALMKIQENEFELGKMAVKEKYRGQGIGQIMLQFCIDFAMDQPWEKITLYSNTILKNSMQIK